MGILIDQSEANRLILKRRIVLHGPLDRVELPAHLFVPHFAQSGQIPNQIRANIFHLIDEVLQLLVVKLQQHVFLNPRQLRQVYHHFKTNFPCCDWSTDHAIELLVELVKSRYPER
ncbi:MAG: hypothetical protein H7840_04600 [Alphaproteobacteria bacterium]